jgi:hypothetical protein
VILDMQAPNRRIKKRGKLYFSSNKALKTSRMVKKKMAHEKYETIGISKVLDFEDTGENVTLSTVAESEGPSMAWGRGSQSQEGTKEVGTQSTPAYNLAMEENSAGEELEETSLMEPEGAILEP